ncbi:hypothetical protein NQD34_001318 [Periophthalmus magnuspinnatus]|nr:hypothetical protein NQD34_001318 [Periophthalmus magnuspinnatus]
MNYCVKKKITCQKITNTFSSTSRKWSRREKRKHSAVWDHFDILTPTKVKCRICSTELSYINKCTSSMLRHYRAKHENEAVPNTPRMNSGIQTKTALDQAALNFTIKDCQPLSIVESEEFRELIHLLDPSYVLPTRKVCLENVVDVTHHVIFD